ncbi:hypothetical protein [Mesorhizobium sp. RMAD-H1]|uniref:hypothetical protein n=1 Tax=Mesorhizobium sp. RMAD-H1 TaxID=2587065 RepID=UPI001612489C|nr:hypothetical protein [Mesorhizobium sp. RMAD-H1]MBB2971876.1 hypothetical protein [Mesorhizobium sp. RMAD-H1]
MNISDLLFHPVADEATIDAAQQSSLLRRKLADDHLGPDRQDKYSQEMPGVMALEPEAV